MTELVEVETQMRLVSPGDVSMQHCAVFDNPMTPAPFVMDPDQWTRMGCPDHVRVRVVPVHPNGLPWHDE